MATQIMPDPHSSSDHFYRRLDVGPDASRDEIVHAYRRLAHGAHPDAHPSDPDAERRFREITEAYEVLADPSRRASYDRTRAVQPIRLVVRPGPTGSSRSAWPVHDVASADPAVFLGGQGPPIADVPLRAGPAVFLGGQGPPIADVPLRAGPARLENPSPGASIRGGDAHEVLMDLFARVFDSWGRP